MTELSPEARDLIERTRSGDDPVHEDRARMDARLSLLLASGAAVATTHVAHAATTGSKSIAAGAKLSWVAAAGAIAATTVAALFFSQHAPNATVVPMPRAVIAEHATGPRAAVPPEPLPEPPPSAEPQQESVTNDDTVRPALTPAAAPSTKLLGSEKRAAARQLSAAEPATTPEPSAPSGLARELALLATARDALRSGHAAVALAALNDHEREFPEGALREERLATQALASCTLGDTQRGRAYLTSLLQLAPSSPLLAKARAACHEATP